MIYRGTDTTKMDAWEAIQLLDSDLGSGQDPITYRGDEMTPMDLGYKVSTTPAQQCRISYFGDVDGKCKLIRGGTLKRMVEDRIELRLGRYKEEHAELPIRALRQHVESKFWPLLTIIRGACRSDLARINKALGEMNQGEHHAND